MYIFALAWLYVIGLLAATRATVIGGALTFVFAGLLPLLLCICLLNMSARRRRASRQSAGNDGPSGNNDKAESHGEHR